MAIRHLHQLLPGCGIFGAPYLALERMRWNKEVLWCDQTSQPSIKKVSNCARVQTKSHENRAWCTRIGQNSLAASICRQREEREANVKVNVHSCVVAMKWCTEDLKPGHRPGHDLFSQKMFVCKERKMLSKYAWTFCWRWRRLFGDTHVNETVCLWYWLNTFWGMLVVLAVDIFNSRARLLNTKSSYQYWNPFIDHSLWKLP